jgi:Tol biopolymer transport system component
MLPGIAIGRTMLARSRELTLGVVASDVVLDGNGPRFTPDGKWLVYVADDDAKFDPIRRVKLDGSAPPVAFESGTVGNGDLDVILAPDGTWRIAWAAQGRTGDKERTFDRLFVGELPKLP